MTEKEKKRLEMYEQRYAESWKKREINEEGTLKPFSKEELEHIFMLKRPPERAHFFHYRQNASGIDTSPRRNRKRLQGLRGLSNRELHRNDLP